MLRTNGSVVVFKSHLWTDVEERVWAPILSGPPPLQADGPACILCEDCVYFIQFVGESGEENGLVKIGYSGQLVQRRHELAREYIGDRFRAGWLRVLGTVPGDRNREAIYHRRFHEFRVFGEWFEPHPDIIEAAQG